VGRLGILGPHAEFVLGRFAFLVLSPALLFTVLAEAEADVAQLFWSRLPISVGRVLSQPIRNLSGLPLFAVVALAALPTSQNTCDYALRFERAVPVARDTVLITTVLSIIALVVIAALLAPRQQGFFVR